MSPPDSSEAGPLHRDRPTAENVATTRVRGQSVTARRQIAQVWAESREVAGRERFRLELYVICACGNRHVHRAPVDFLSGLRRPPCGGPRYVVHAAITLEAVA